MIDVMSSVVSLLYTWLWWDDGGVGPVIEGWESNPCDYKKSKKMVRFKPISEEENFCFENSLYVLR